MRVFFLGVSFTSLLFLCTFLFLPLILPSLPTGLQCFGFWESVGFGTADVGCFAQMSRAILSALFMLSLRGLQTRSRRNGSTATWRRLVPSYGIAGDGQLLFTHAIDKGDVQVSKMLFPCSAPCTHATSASRYASDSVDMTKLPSRGRAVSVLVAQQQCFWPRLVLISILSTEIVAQFG